MIGRMQFVPTGANNYGLLLNVADLTASRQKIALSQGEGDYVLVNSGSGCGSRKAVCPTFSYRSIFEIAVSDV